MFCGGGREFNLEHVECEMIVGSNRPRVRVGVGRRVCGQVLRNDTGGLDSRKRRREADEKNTSPKDKIKRKGSQG